MTLLKTGRSGKFEMVVPHDDYRHREGVILTDHGSDQKDGRRTRYLLAMLFIILATAIFVTSYAYYQQYEKDYKIEIGHKLTAISDLKVNQLDDWKTERLGDAGTFSHNPLFSSRVSHLFSNASDTETQVEVRTWLEKELKYSQYNRVYLMDTNGTIRMSAPVTQRPVAAAVIQQLPLAVQSGNITTLDFYRDDNDQKIYITTIVPLYDDQEGGKPLGFIAFEVDPALYLYPFISTWPGKSASGETLILRREGNDVVYLNDLRFSNNSALNLRFPLERTDLPAVKAALGEEGIVEGKDYRGVTEIASIRKVPDTPWFLVARVDSSEVYGPLREQFINLILIVAILLIGIGMGIGIIWRGESTRFYREMYESEREVHKEREKTSSYLGIVGATVLAIATDQTVIMINPAGCRLLGRHEEEILGKNWFDTFLPERVRELSRESFIQMVTGTMGQPEQVENVIITADGEERLVAWHSTLIRDENQKITGILRSGEDITDRIRTEKILERQNEELQAANEELMATEEELKSQFDELSAIQRELWKSEERLNLALDATNDGIWDWDVPTGSAFFSPHWYTMLGYEPDELPGSYTTWRSLVHPDDLTGTERVIQDAVNKNEGYSTEFRMRTKQGDWRWILTRGCVVQRGPDGDPVRMVGTHTDITGRKMMEDTLLRVNQKLNVLTQLTRKDLTHKIFVLNSYLELAKKYAAGQDRVIEYIQKSNQAARAITEITEITRDYQDMGAYPPRWQNVNMVILLGLSHISMGEIHHSLEMEQLEIFADPLLEKAFQGLFENTMAHGGEVTRIRVWHTITPAGATIFYEDDGTGIPQNKKEHIFLRGESTRTAVRGLFFVRDILDITGITVTETGEPGKGARFEITVPKGMWRLTGSDT